MAVFAVIAPTPNERLEAAVKLRFPDRWFVIAPGQYLVSADRAVPTQVMEKLGLTGGGLGRAIILQVTSYTGWHTKDIWDWIAAQTAPPPFPMDTPSAPE